MCSFQHPLVGFGVSSALSSSFLLTWWYYGRECGGGGWDNVRDVSVMELYEPHLNSILQ
jgi:hypothetical protein